MAETLLRARGLTVQRAGRTLLQGADLTLEPGRIVTLIGPNGAGKTTLVRCALGLMRPDAGRVERRPGLRVGYMPQQLHIDPSLPLTVRRFLTLGGKPRLPLEQALEWTGTGHLSNATLSHLSGGETQRVLLARALIRDPQLLVLDEPVQGVDVSGQERLYGLIDDIRRQRDCGVLLVSHDLHLVMAKTDTVVCLNQHVCCHGHPETITSDPAYLALFGDNHKPLVAPYAHHHDHRHDDHGNIVERDRHA